jgi:hypothetical protein
MCRGTQLDYKFAVSRFEVPSHKSIHIIKDSRFRARPHRHHGQQQQRLYYVFSVAKISIHHAPIQAKNNKKAHRGDTHSELASNRKKPALRARKIWLGIYFETRHSAKKREVNSN